MWGQQGFNDEFLAHWVKKGDWFEGRQKFAYRGGKMLRVMLLLRMEGAGAVFFDDVEARETTPIARRVAKVASCPVMPLQKDTVRAGQLAGAFHRPGCGCQVRHHLLERGHRRPRFGFEDGGADSRPHV